MIWTTSLIGALLVACKRPFREEIKLQPEILLTAPTSSAALAQQVKQLAQQQPARGHKGSSQAQQGHCMCSRNQSSASLTVCCDDPHTRNHGSIGQSLVSCRDGHTTAQCQIQIDSVVAAQIVAKGKVQDLGWMGGSVVDIDG